MKHLDLFSGIGGFAYAVDQVFENAEHEFVEIDPFCQRVLRKHWPNSKIHGDIRRFIRNTKGKRHTEKPQVSQGETTYTERGHRTFILTGGFPCQPFSQAGRRRGTDDNRYLWPEMFRVIQLTRPQWVIAENVYGLVTWQRGMVLEQTCTDLEAEGYEVQPLIIPACGVNAPHQRYRVWIVAHRLGTNGRRKNDETAENKGRETSSNRPEGIQPQDRKTYSNNSQQGNHNVKNAIRQRSGGGMESGRQILESQSTEAENAGPSWEEDWIKVATELCGVFNGISPRLYKGMNDGIYFKYAEIFGKIKGQDLPCLWENFQSKKIQWKTGRFDPIQNKEYVFTVLWKYSFESERQDNPSFESKEVQEAYLRNVWGKGQPGCPPQGWRYNKQYAKKHSDSLSQLSHEVALATKEVHEEYNKHRKERLRSLGNAIVPQVAVELLKALKSQPT